MVSRALILYPDKVTSFRNGEDEAALFPSKPLIIVKLKLPVVFPVKLNEAHFPLSE